MSPEVIEKQHIVICEGIGDERFFFLRSFKNGK